MKREKAIVLSFLFVSTLSVIVALMDMGLRRTISKTAGNKAMLIKVEGEIHSGKSTYQSSGADTVISKLKEAEQNPEVKGILLEINSPGGTVAASQEIYHEVLNLKKTKKVVVSMKDMAASGGYYIASAADYIFAESGTITGSIGVIAMTPVIDKFLDKHSIKVKVYKAGKYKDVMSMFKESTPEEDSIVENLLSDTYDQFIKDVAAGRNLKVEHVKKIAEGKIYSGTRAIRANLVDEIGGRREALLKLTQLSDSNTELQLLEEEEFPLDKFMQMFHLSSGEQSKLLQHTLLDKLRFPVMVVLPSYLEKIL